MIGANAIMDIVLIGLLVAALWFGVRLDKRLKALRAAHDGFAKAVHELDNAAIRAHSALKELRGHADESQDLLHGRILAARDVMQKLEAQAMRAERAQLALDRGLTAFESTQNLRAQPALRPVEASAMREDVPVPRRPFDRDQVAAPMGAVRRGENLLSARKAEEQNEAETLDKVQMSELVVANLNEMIRTLTLPSRQVPQSLEDDLFGDAAPQARPPFTRSR